jgi:secreted Zn-dependent insulinase-like peptidase
MIDLLVHMMDEPLYDRLRTQEQLGYHVGIDARWTHGIMGLCVQIVTATHAADTVWERLQEFLCAWRQTVVDQSPADFVEHLAGLATQKLDRFDALHEVTDALWDEICDGRFEWQAWRDEAVILRTMTKERVLQAFDTWIQPAVAAHKRRILVVRVIAATTAAAATTNDEDGDAAMNESNGNATDSTAVAADGATPVIAQAAQGRPDVSPDDWGDYVDAQVAHFGKTVCKQQTWGRVNSKLF